MVLPTTLRLSPHCMHLSRAQGSLREGNAARCRQPGSDDALGKLPTTSWTASRGRRRAGHCCGSPYLSQPNTDQLFTARRPNLRRACAIGVAVTGVPMAEAETIWTEFGSYRLAVRKFQETRVAAVVRC